MNAKKRRASTGPRWSSSTANPFAHNASSASGSGISDLLHVWHGILDLYPDTHSPGYAEHLIIMLHPVDNMLKNRKDSRPMLGAVPFPCPHGPETCARRPRLKATRHVEDHRGRLMPSRVALAPVGVYRSFF